MVKESIGFMKGLARNYLDSLSRRDNLDDQISELIEKRDAEFNKIKELESKLIEQGRAVYILDGQPKRIIVTVSKMATGDEVKVMHES